MNNIEQYFDCCQWIGDINDNNEDNGKWCEGKVKKISDIMWECDKCKRTFTNNTIKMIYGDNL